MIVHVDTVTRVTGPADGPQSVWLAGSARPLVADVVVFAIGHMDARTHGPEGELADFARRHGADYLPPAYTADVDLDDIPGGEPLLVRGLGLAFVDLMVLLTEGRGGEYRTAPDGTLTYLPSGREPLLYAGSRRGVPYHAKIGYGLTGDRPPLPRFFSPDVVRDLVKAHDRLDFREHVWPLVAKEIGWGYYAKLDRIALPWPEFARRYAELDWYSEGMRALVAEAVPDPADRLDLEALDHPIRGLRFDDPDRFQEFLRGYVGGGPGPPQRSPVRRGPGRVPGAAVLLRASYPHWSRPADWIPVRGGTAWRAGGSDSSASTPAARRATGWSNCSRCPARACVRFLGADMWVRADEERGRVRGWRRQHGRGRHGAGAGGGTAAEGDHRAHGQRPAAVPARCRASASRRCWPTATAAG